MATFEPAAYFRNCIGTAEQGDGWAPLRFTQAQLALYAKSDATRVRSRCPSGACVDLVSDTSELTIHYHLGESARDWAYFDCFLDGNLIQSVGTMPIESDRGCVSFRVPSHIAPGPHRFTVYLPHLVEVTVRALERDADSRVEPAPLAQRRILCAGDSITQGMSSLRPSASYPVLLAQALDAELVNLGVGGYVFDHESVDRLGGFSPDLITIAYGTNDWGQAQSVTEIERTCSEYLDRTRQLFSDQPVWVITPIWRADIDEPRLCGTFSDMTSAISKAVDSREGVYLLEGLGLVPHMPEFFGDRTLHPNDEGFLRMALNLLPAMQHGKPGSPARREGTSVPRA